LGLGFAVFSVRTKEVYPFPKAHRASGYLSS